MADITKVYLLNVPIEKDYKHTLYFANKEAQQSYFQSHIVNSFSFNDFTYQRKDNIIRVPRHIDNLYNCNYVMYQNSAYSNKWFYAFINNMEYRQDDRTDVHIETDVIQTWAFDYTFKTSFVEREHVSDDTIGLHTIPEGLETGEYICNSHVIDDKMDNITSELCYIISSTANLYEWNGDKYTMAGMQTYNGIASGSKYYRFANAAGVKAKLQEAANQGQIDVVNGLFMAPTILAQTASDMTLAIHETNAPETYNNAISKQTNLQGYVPKNKKLLCYPYNYMLVSNNNGQTYNYNYEDFSTSDCEFKIDMSLTPGCSIRMIPKNYKGVAENDEYGINMGKLPICSWSCDMYTNWLTQNSINVAGHSVSSDDLNVGMAATNAVVGTIASVASGNVAGAVSSAVGGVGGVTSALIAKKQHELIPSQAKGNLNSGDVITSSGKNNYHFYKMSIKQEYAKIIDKYFNLYGYLVNDLKVPNTNHRENYWFTKTLECNIIGNLPQDDLVKIKDIYNSGITFWRNPANIKDYSVSNNII